MAGYGSDEDFATWATASGYTVPDGSVSAARQRGSVYLDGLYEDRFPGAPTGGIDQERSWPRTGAEDRYGNTINSTIVPGRVICASYQAALLELQSPGSLSALIAAAAVVKSEQIGAIRTEYQVGTGCVAADATPISTMIEGLLAPLLTTPTLPGVLVV